MAGRVVLTTHALSQARRRGISEALVRQVATAPAQIMPVRSGREVRQSRFGTGLVRVVVDRCPDDIVVVTVYRTTKLAKYWRGP